MWKHVLLSHKSSRRYIISGGADTTGRLWTRKLATRTSHYQFCPLPDIQNVPEYSVFRLKYILNKDKNRSAFSAGGIWETDAPKGTRTPV
jgi:hypothetical protein